MFSLSSAEELSCLGVIRKKLKVDATDDSYAKARLSMAQAEEETRSQRTIVIKGVGRDRGRCGNQGGLHLKVGRADAGVKNTAGCYGNAWSAAMRKQPDCFHVDF